MRDDAKDLATGCCLPDRSSARPRALAGDQGADRSVGRARGTLRRGGALPASRAGGFLSRVWCVCFPSRESRGHAPIFARASGVCGVAFTASRRPVSILGARLSPAEERGVFERRRKKTTRLNVSSDRSSARPRALAGDRAERGVGRGALRRESARPASRAGGILSRVWRVCFPNARVGGTRAALRARVRGVCRGLFSVASSGLEF